MIGFIGSLFVGIFGILDKLLPGKKKDYFLKFDDAQGAGQPQTEAKAAQPEAPKPETPQPEAEAAKPEPAKPAAAKAQPKKPAAPAPAAPAPAAPAPAAPKPAEPVVLFAPNYLLPKPTASRRRPSANMAMFLEMSREMNIRK